MVGCIAQRTGVEGGPHIVLIDLSAADRREDAVLHIDAVHVRNPGSGTHGLILCTVLTSGADTRIAKMKEPQRRSEVEV